MSWRNPLVCTFGRWGAVLGLVMLLLSCSNGGNSGGGGGSTPSTQSNLPPDPGAAGLASLAGIDSNNNGVRDDIERYIALSYPADTDAGTRAALTQYTKAAQATVLDATDPAASRTHADELIDAVACIRSKRPDDGPEVFGLLRAEILNTMDRSRAYLTAQQNAAVTIFNVASACKNT